jgi:hypothetical protein
MGKVVVALLVLVGVALWRLRNSPGVGEQLRTLSDLPTNAALLGTSGFEREGRDPAKA